MSQRLLSAHSGSFGNFGRHVSPSFAKLCAAWTPECIISRCLLVTIACPRNRWSLPGFTGWLVANLPMWQCRATRRPDTQIARDTLKPPPSRLRRLSPSMRNETSWTNRKDRSGRCRVSVWPLAHPIRTVGLGGTLISELLELDLWEPCVNVTLKLNNQRNNSPFFNTFFSTWGS